MRRRGIVTCPPSCRLRFPHTFSKNCTHGQQRVCPYNFLPARFAAAKRVQTAARLLSFNLHFLTRTPLKYEIPFFVSLPTGKLEKAVHRQIEYPRNNRPTHST